MKKSDSVAECDRTTIATLLARKCSVVLRFHAMIDKHLAMNRQPVFTTG